MKRALRRVWCWYMNHKQWTRLNGSVWCYGCGMTVRPADE